jgi:flagellar basal-body rod modification protein FlgD
MSSTIDTSTYQTTTDSLASAAASRRTSSSSSLSESLNFEDYITLMVAELQNQDMYNQMDTSEMTSQMAQYSLVTAAEEIMQMQNTSYAATLVGQQVTASYSSTSGDLVTNTGVVTGVTLYDGEPLVYVNGTPYNLSEIMVIGSTSASSSESDTAAEENATGAEEIAATETENANAADTTKEAEDVADTTKDSQDSISEDI